MIASARFLANKNRGPERKRRAQAQRTQEESKAMLQNRVTSTTVTALLRAGQLALPAAAAEPNSAPVTAVRQTSQTQELRPFTHFARIPTGSDPATMRLEKIRSVKVPISATVPSGYLL